MSTQEEGQQNELRTPLLLSGTHEAELEEQEQSNESQEQGLEQGEVQEQEQRKSHTRLRTRQVSFSEVTTTTTDVDVTRGVELQGDDGQSDNNNDSSSEDNENEDEPKRFKRSWLGFYPSPYFVLPSTILTVVSMALLAPVFPGLKLQWYTDCLLSANDKACLPNKDAAQFYSGVYDSLRGLLGFLTAAMLGRFSDASGRKPIMLFSEFMSGLPILALFLTGARSPEAYFSASILSGIGITGISATISYVSDLCQASEAVVFFGYISAAASLSMFISVLVSADLAEMLTITQLLMLALGLKCINVLYLIFIVPESLDVTNSTKMSWRTIDPVAPLRLLQRSPVIKWLSLSIFFMSVTASGLMEVALIYVDTVLNLSPVDGIRVNGYIFATFGLSGVFSNLVVLRWFKWMEWRETTMMIVLTCINVFHLLLYVLLTEVPRIELLLFIEVLAGAGAAFNPAANALVVKHMGPLEQGFAFGTLFAVKGLTAAISPLLFGSVQAYFDKVYNFQGAALLLGACVTSLSLVVTAGPLKRVLARPMLVTRSHSMMFSPSYKNNDSVRRRQLSLERANSDHSLATTTDATSVHTDDSFVGVA